MGTLDSVGSKAPCSNLVADLCTVLSGNRPCLCVRSLLDIEHLSTLSEEAWTFMQADVFPSFSSCSALLHRNF